MFFPVLFGFICFSGSLINGIQGQWTYADTNSSCAATTDDPCGPPYWYKVSATCNGQRQSPVDISLATPNSNLPLPVFYAKNGGCTVRNK